MKLKSIIAISGRICSGKTFAAKLIRDKFGLPIASFGEYLKYYCGHNNLATDRKTLQDAGEAFVRENPKQFLIDVITHYIGSYDTVILEGVRHKSILDEIKMLTDNSLIVFIDADLETRYNRYLKREEGTQLKNFEQFINSDNHPVELEIEDLKPLSNIIIDATKEYSVDLFRFLEMNFIFEEKVKR